MSELRKLVKRHIYTLSVISGQGSSSGAGSQGGCVVSVLGAYRSRPGKILSNLVWPHS